MADACQGPTDATAVRRGYTEVIPTAKVVLSEVANGLAFDRRTYEERMDESMVQRVANVLFAAALPVRCDTEQMFEVYHQAHADAEVVVLGAATAETVCWHHARVGEVIITAGYADAERSAAEVVRRAAFNRCYRPIIEED
jgi:hypothetical protein